jgi:hypothetical protein
MPLPGGSPDAVPYGADRTVFMVVDSLGTSESSGQEAQVEHEDFETVLIGFITGRFRDPVRVLAFNTLEHWSQDISSDVAREIQARCDIDGIPVPEHVRDFLERHTTPSGDETASL